MITKSTITSFRNEREALCASDKWPWGSVSDANWNDWVWQLRHSLRNITAFLPLLADSLRAEANEDASLEFPFAVTPHYAKLIAEHPEAPELARLVLPTANEFIPFPGQLVDPTGEEEVSPAPGLRHMYPDRVLFTLTYICPSYCRYCFRRRVVGLPEGLSYDEIEEGLAYIREHEQIREVILSGGEPFLLSDSKIARLLSDLRGISHLEVVRFHTRAPVYLPQRFTPDLLSVLRNFKPVYINISVCHPAELSPETRNVFNRLADAGFPLGSQTPLLAGINNSVETMKTLMLQLLKERVRPYYIHNSIPVTGSAHFRTNVAEGVEIIRSLRGFVSGLAVPTFSVFLSDAGGKVSVEPEYLLGRQDGKLAFRNYKGNIYHYPDDGP